MEKLSHELHHVHTKLGETQQNFIRQISALDDEMESLHKQILSIGINNPEQKEMLEFIVFINDRLETRQTQFEEILKDVITEILSNKKHVININKKIIKRMESLEPKPNIFMRMLSKIQTISDVKTLIGIFLGIALLYAHFQGQSIDLLKEMVTIFLGK